MAAAASGLGGAGSAVVALGGGGGGSGSGSGSGSQSVVDLSLDLLRRLPPSDISHNLSKLLSTCPNSLSEDLIGSVDEPPVVKVDDSPEGAGREFLACDYNRDGDSWRSPWSNRFLPEELEDGTRPSQRLRQLEEKAMEAFSTYRQLYYESGISSCYFWDLDDSNFAGAIVIRSQLSAGRVQGSWNSLHVFEATELGVKSVSYKLTSTVMLSFDVKQQQQQQKGDKEGSAAVGDGSGNGKEQQKKGNMNLSGSLTRQSEEKLPLPDYASHIANLGKMVEEMEAKQRNLLQTVYFGKTLDVLNSVRSPESLDAKRKERELQKELMGLWKRPGVES